MKTLNEIIDIIEAYATDHKQVNTFAFGSIDKIDNLQVTYPLIWVSPTDGFIRKSVNQQRNQQMKKNRRGLNILFLDLVQPNFDEDILGTNEREVYSDQEQIMIDLVLYIQNDPTLKAANINIPEDITTAPVHEKFKDIVSGWRMSLLIEEPITRAYCSAPVDGIATVV